MTAGWAIAGCLAGGVVAVAWPHGNGRRRLGARRLRPLSGRSVDRSGTRAVDLAAVGVLDPVGTRFDSAGIRALDLAEVRAAIASVAAYHPRRLIAGLSALAAVAGLVAGGPVAALVGGAYGALAVRATIRRVAAQRAAADRARSLDELGSLVADLRAGLPQGSVAWPALPVTEASRRTPFDSPVDGRRIADLTAAVWRLAEQTGAPAADLVERIEADARAADRARASASAQAAGAQATALLLAALPLGGIALGYAIGADPLRVLLHTPVGVACAVGSVLLQCAGLLWADRLTGGGAR